MKSGCFAPRHSFLQVAAAAAQLGFLRQNTLFAADLIPILCRVRKYDRVVLHLCRPIIDHV